MPRIKARKELRASLSSKSIDKLIAELQDYQRKIQKASGLIVKRLLELGYEVGEVAIMEAQGGDEDKEIGGFELLTNNLGDLYTGKLILSGRQVLFFEFGAGVYYNNGKRNPLSDKYGYGVGSFSPKGHYKEKGWSYEADNGDKMFTHGTEAAMPMYKASKEMRENIERIAREVFQDVIK